MPASKTYLSLCALLFFASAALADEKKPATAPSCVVRIASVKVDVVTLRAKGAAPVVHDESTVFEGLQDPNPSADDRQTDEKMLIVKVEVKNVSREPCVYWTLNGTDAKCKTLASLVDEGRKAYALANFGELDVVGALKEARTLAPGETVKDVLVFELPPKTVKGLKLWLPEKNLGATAKLEPLTLPVEGLKVAGS